MAKYPGVYLRGRIWWMHYVDAHKIRHFEPVGPSLRSRARTARRLFGPTGSKWRMPWIVYRIHHTLPRR